MFSFASVFFKAYGYTDFQIGQLAAISSLVVIVAQPIFGVFADRVLSVKTLIIINLVISACVTGLVYLFKSNFIMLFICYALISFSEKSLTSLIDSWISIEVRYDASINYGLSRGFGSLGFALSSVIGGVIFEKAGFGTLFILHAAFLLVATIVTSITPMFFQRSNPIAKIEKQPKSVKLYKNWEYIRIVAVATILFLGVSVEVTYFPVIFQLSGGTNSQLGVALFIMSLSELVAMASYKKINNLINTQSLMLIALVFYTFKLFFQIFLNNVLLLVMLQLMQGVTYGLFLPSFVELVRECCNENNTSTAITVGFAVFNGIGSVIGNFIAGIISEQFGLRYAFAVASLLCFCSIIFYCFRPINITSLKKQYM